MKDYERMYEEACECYLTENNPKASERAFELFGELAQDGYEAAYLLFGLCYFYGVGTGVDYKTAIEWMNKSLEEGYTQAPYYLGVCYYDGLGVEADRGEAYMYFRLAADYGVQDALELLRNLEFSDEDKKGYEDFYVGKIIEDGELDGHLEMAKEENATSQYLLANYYADKGDFCDALRWARRAKRNCFGAAGALIGRILGMYLVAKKQIIVDKKEEYEASPVLCDGHEPNAVYVGVFGGSARPIYIEDFSSYAGLGVPLGCERINIVSTKGMRYLSLFCDTTVVGYVDAYGQSKELVNNSVMSTISGYDYLAGGCVVCGFDKDYAPMQPCDAYALAHYLSGFDVYDDGRMFESMISEL